MSYANAATRQLVVETLSDGDCVVLAACGELDLASAPILERALAKAEQSPAHCLVLDLAGLEFIDSTGLRVLLDAHRRSQSNGREFSLRRPARQARRLFTVTRAATVFSFEDPAG